MYGFLRTRLSKPAADTLCALWYFTLVLVIMYSAFEPQAEFNYLRF